MSSMGIRSLQLDSAKNGDRMAEIDFILEASPRFEFFFFFFFFTFTLEFYVCFCNCSQMFIQECFFL